MSQQGRGRAAESCTDRGLGACVRRATTVVVMLLASAGAASGQQFEMVGHTQLSYPGDTGVLAFTEACQVDFGPSARMCSVEEVWHTSTLPPNLVEPAWVRKAPSTDGVQFTANPLVSQSGDCLGWSSSSASGLGLTVTTSGGQASLDCSVARPVACCTLVPEPSLTSGLIPGAVLLCAIPKARQRLGLY